MARRGCSTRACGAINEGRSHPSHNSLRRHTRTPRARAGVSRQRGLEKPAGSLQGAGRTRGGTAAAAARLAGRRGAEAEGARGEGQPGFDSRRGLTVMPRTYVRPAIRKTNRPAIFVGEAGPHALPWIEPGRPSYPSQSQLPSLLHAVSFYSRAAVTWQSVRLSIQDIVNMALEPCRLSRSLHLRHAAPAPSRKTRAEPMRLRSNLC